MRDQGSIVILTDFDFRLPVSSGSFKLKMVLTQVVEIYIVFSIQVC